MTKDGTCCFFKIIFLILLTLAPVDYVQSAANDATSLRTSPSVPYQANPNGYTGRAYGYSSDTFPYGTGSAIPSNNQLGSGPAEYMPCPGDPSTMATSAIPAYPICPDINGNITPDPNYPNFTTATKNSTYPNPIYSQDFQNFYSTGYIYSVTNLQAFCPQYCVTSRRSTPPPTFPINASQPVSSFVTANCPDGYFEVATFNVQPAIQYLQAPQTLFGPFTQAEYNTYKTNPAYTCSVSYVTWGNTIAPLSIAPANVPYYNYGSPVNTSSIMADYEQLYCSSLVNQTGGYIGADSPPVYNVDMPIGPNNYIGQWIPQWTWSDFWNNVGVHYTFFSTTYWSFNDSACTGAWSRSWATHYDRWHHNARYERCKFAQPYGWFYTTAVEPITHLCARVTPGWQKTY